MHLRLTGTACGRGHCARPGAIRRGGGQLTRPGTGFLSPTASKVPGRREMSPDAWKAPTASILRGDPGALSIGQHRGMSRSEKGSLIFSLVVLVSLLGGSLVMLWGIWSMGMFPQ